MRPRASCAVISFRAAMQTGCLLAILTLAACGGSNNTTSTYTPPTPPTSVIENYKVGGTITGLTTGSLVLANGTATVTVSANATSWIFSETFDPGTSYSVTVKTQPVGELCQVTSGGSGTDTGTVGNVTVVCAFGQWTWNGGSNAGNATGNYGTQGAALATNVPGARYSSSSWTDSTGNLWLFGGVGYDSTGTTGYLNDLWEYDPTTKLWTWVSGANVDNAIGVYGTEGTAAAGNAPGARYAAISWRDSTGNLWLFGGYGYDTTGALGSLNDLWQYSPSTKLWTWFSGANAANAAGVYGAKGTALSTNVPGARYSASAWTDASGKLWLFGGYGYDAAGVAGNLSDLWQYSPTTKLWTWVNGVSGVNASGTYGTEGTAAATIVPGARYAASAGIDASGNMWMFGGYGYDATGVEGKLSDLWKYVPSTGYWTWVGGEDGANATAVYGVLGTAATTNLPGARQAATFWVDSTGNLWLFGGVGYDATGSVGNLNDLWQYSTSTSEWTWFSGGYRDNGSGVYGTLGTASPSNVPGARNLTNSWIDSTGNLWLFGGDGYDSAGALGYLNDLWKYTPQS